MRSADTCHFDKSIFTGLTSKYHLHLQVQGVRACLVRMVQQSAINRFVSGLKSLQLLVRSPTAGCEVLLRDNTIESSESKDVEDKS